MNWLSRLFSGQEAANRALTPEQERLLDAWNHRPIVETGRSHYCSRYVVVDVETTGLDPATDRPVAIGALAVVDGLIDFKESFLVTLANGPTAHTDQPSTHADSPSSSAARADALIAFLDFAGKAPLVAYHADFVGGMIARAVSDALGVELRQTWLDLAWVLSDLFRDIDTQGRLDAWLAHFNVESIRRHQALSDAYATAKLLQIAIARAARKGFDTPASLFELEKARRHMRQNH